MKGGKAKKRVSGIKDGSILLTQDPRVQKSVGELLKALAAGEAMSREQLAKALKISKDAVSLRTVKALKLGLVKRSKRGWIVLA